MVQWFKNLFKRKQKTQLQLLLDFNMEELGSKMQVISTDLFRCRQDDAMKVIKLMLETSRNIQILEINRFKAGDKMQQLEHQLGRLEVLNDLMNFVSSSLDPAVYNQRKEKAPEKVRILKTSFERSQPVIQKGKHNMATIYRGGKASLDLIAKQKAGKAEVLSASDTVKAASKSAKKPVKKASKKKQIDL